MGAWAQSVGAEGVRGIGREEGEAATAAFGGTGCDYRLGSGVQLLQVCDGVLHLLDLRWLMVFAVDGSYDLMCDMAYVS